MGGISLLVLMQMHAAHSRRMPSEDLEAVPALGTPNAKSAVRGATDDQVSDHLR